MYHKATDTNAAGCDEPTYITEYYNVHCTRCEVVVYLYIKTLMHVFVFSISFFCLPAQCDCMMFSFSNSMTVSGQPETHLLFICTVFTVTLLPVLIQLGRIHQNITT